MKIRDLVLVSGTLVLLIVVQHGEGTIMLTSMLLAAKTGMLVGKMGVGGLMMMMLAASNQNNHNNAAYGKKRTIRSVDGQEDESEKVEKEEIVIRKRLVRQMDSAFDAMTCLPKFVCGINAQTPSKKTSLMNDYGHLLKVIMLPESLSDDDDENSEEQVQFDDEGAELVAEEKDKLEELAHDSLIEDDPSMLPFVLKEVIKRRNNKKKGSNRNGLQPMDESFPSPPIPHRPAPRPRPSPFSISSYLPKIEAGLGTKTADSDFDNDPFFAGFKRSLSASVKNLEVHGLKEGSVALIDNTEVEEDSVPMTRRARGSFIRRMSTKLSKVTDPVEKYKIAEEVGKKLKTEEACTKVFKKCPYKWEEVMGMVGNLRNVITAHPVVEAIMADPNKNTSTTSAADQVVYLKNPGGGTPNMVTIKSKPTPMNSDGMTTVVHDLGSGNMLQISMQVMKPAPVKTTNLPVIESAEDDIPVVQNETDITTAEPVNAESQISAATLALQTKNTNGSWSKKVKPKPLILPVLLDDPSPPEFIDDEREDFHIPLKLQPDMQKPRDPVPTTPLKTVKRKVGSEEQDTTAEDELDEEDEDADAEGDDEDEISDDDDFEDEHRSRAQQLKGFESIPASYLRTSPTAELRSPIATVLLQKASKKPTTSVPATTVEKTIVRRKLTYRNPIRTDFRD